MSTSPDPAGLTIEQARGAMDAGELTALELTEAVLAQVERLNPDLRAYLHVDAQGALGQARALDRASEPLPLTGIPICVKDVIDVAGMPTTAGAAHWRRLPERDAGSVARLRAAGAIIIGKGNTNEFAYGIDGRNPHFGDCRNPLDRARITGGSSSGPAAATAGGMALAGLATDTSGSIRVPASFCGLVGIRPTLSRLPLTGVVPLAWSYDVVGPLARTVGDAKILFEVLSGRDAPSDGPRRWRIALMEQLLEFAEPYVENAIRAVASELEAGGAHVRSVSFERLSHANAVHQIVQHAEASQVHEPWFEAERAHYSDPVRLRLGAGRLLPAAAYLRAQQARRLIADEFASAFERCDALLAPSAPCTAPILGVEEVTLRGTRHELRAALLHCAQPASQIGYPVIALPVGSYEGLPFGMQIIGRPYAEKALLSLAAQVVG